MVESEDIWPGESFRQNIRTKYSRLLYPLTYFFPYFLLC